MLNILILNEFQLELKRAQSYELLSVTLPLFDLNENVKIMTLTSQDMHNFGMDMDMDMNININGKKSRRSASTKSSQHCRTVTQQIGNTVTTYTQCS